VTSFGGAKSLAATPVGYSLINSADDCGARNLA
jgi:hypothetical protein